MAPEAFLLDELLGDDIVGAKEEPADEERAVIGLEKSKRGIGPVFLRRPEFVLRVNHRVKPVALCLAASQSRHPYRHTS
ncbi:uncharacterized protein ARMOST_21284 [Armillaria ostoyae]|uniref:Uncharacterized protein n=1 Tax=Armillaria ostoyae TaxID=47428 RepID=A0A284S9N0_ARMOS|nr:uncharacterized protein ARMOST_21284 [Armillaria ostoyae]